MALADLATQTSKPPRWAAWGTNRAAERILQKLRANGSLVPFLGAESLKLMSLI
jgi:hypothetical protein